MDNLAKKLINDHRNPLVKVDLPGSKLFLKSSTQEEAEFIEKHQTNLENILSHARAERRNARSQAIWSPEDKLAKVTKSIKTLNNFGYRDKNGMYLYPEETLLLMETNRLEVTFNEVPLSIQEGYDLLLKSPECDTIKYRVYKKLALLGYKVLRYSEVLRRLSKMTDKLDQSRQNDVQNNDCNRKRISISEQEDFSPKKKKLEKAELQDSVTDVTEIKERGDDTSSSEPQSEHIRNLFEKLRENAPREYENDVTDDVVPQYCVFLPNNKSRCDYDFNLYICEDSILKMNHTNHSTPSIFAICSLGNISFYKYSNVKLPYL